MSAQSGSKSMTIMSRELPKNVNLVFSFTGLGNPDPSVVWRAHNFEANVNESYTIKYTPQFRFIEPIVNDKRIVGEEAMIDIKVGQQTTFNPHGSTRYDYFTPPTPGAPGLLMVKNNGRSPADLALGFPPQLLGQMNVARYFPNVEPKKTLSIKWKPTLYAYVFVDGHHQQNEILREVGVGPIWSHDMNTLPPSSEWGLFHNDHGYQLIPANAE